MTTGAPAQGHEERILAFLSEGAEDFTSGEVLSGRLGLSRATVWKVVEGLRAKGYRIEAVPARGYRLLGGPDRLSALEVSPHLTTRALGRTLHYFETLPSTNELAFRLAAQGAGHGEVVLCEQQTAGRGRRGRQWVSPPGKNLALSVILRPRLPPQAAPELTLVAAVALAQTLREVGAAAAIKWPNDVQLSGLKVAGILTELSAEPERVSFVVLGLGVNLNAGTADLPPELAATATSVATVLGRPVSRARFAAALLGHLEAWLDRHAAEGFGPVREAWKALSSTLGQQVVVRTERSELKGVAEDVDASGALLVRREDGSLERVLAGDVEQLRPRAPTSTG